MGASKAYVAAGIVAVLCAVGVAWALPVGLAGHTDVLDKGAGRAQAIVKFFEAPVGGTAEVAFEERDGRALRAMLFNDSGYRAYVKDPLTRRPLVEARGSQGAFNFTFPEADVYFLRFEPDDAGFFTQWHLHSTFKRDWPSETHLGVAALLAVAAALAVPMAWLSVRRQNRIDAGAFFAKRPPPPPTMGP